MTKDSHGRVKNLYSSHNEWLIKWLYRRIGCIHDANDLAQDTFVRILSRPRNLKQIRKPRPWLSVIAKGIMVDHIRRMALEAAYKQTLSLLPGKEEPTPETRIIMMEAIERIDAMLDGINPRARSAFLLSRITGLTYPEIALKIGVSLSSVEKYMAQAIRHCLKAGHDN